MEAIVGRARRLVNASRPVHPIGPGKEIRRWVGVCGGCQNQECMALLQGGRSLYYPQAERAQIA